MKTASPISPVESRMQERAVEALRDALADMPETSVELGSGYGVASVLFRSGQRELPFVLEVKSSGQPRFLREAILRAKVFRAQKSKQAVLFAAPVISDEAAKMLAEARVNYVDFTGRCLIQGEGIYISKEGKGSEKFQRREMRTLFSPKAERVLRVMMEKPKQVWKMAPLAQAAGVSLGQAQNVKQFLEEREWGSRKPGGFYIREPRKILEEWVTDYGRRKQDRAEFYSLDSMDEIEKKIAGENGVGVLTGFSAAARLAPMVRYQRVMGILRQPADGAVESLGLKKVPSGGNVLLMTLRDEGMLIGSKTMDGVEIASPTQIYLDLKNTEGRGEEAADALLRQSIEPLW